MHKIHITTLIRPGRRQHAAFADEEAATVELAAKVDLIPTLDFVVLNKEVVKVSSSAEDCSSLTSADTYVIVRDRHSDSDALSLKDFNLSFKEKLSYIDEPTSSMTIEMDNPQKSLTTTSTVPTTSTSGQATPTSTRNTPSEQSIDEDIIEEILEISDDNDLVPLRKLQVTDSSLENDSEIDFDKPGPSKQSQYQRRLLSSTSVGSDDKFKIDDEQLSGGKLAQHFVLDDTDDDSLLLAKNLVHSRHKSSSLEEADQSTTDDVSDIGEEGLKQAHRLDKKDDLDKIDDLDKSDELHKNDGLTSMLASEVMSSESSNLPIELKKTSKLALSSEDSDLPVVLTKLSSAESSSMASDSPVVLGKSPDKDLSSEASEAPAAEEPSEHSTEEFDLPLPDESTAVAQLHAEIKTETDVLSHIQKTASADRADSPEHSEKNNSFDEVIARNASIEMSFDTTDLSSLNTSFDLLKNSLVHRLLDDTLKELHLTSMQAAQENAVETPIVTDLDASEEQTDFYGNPIKMPEKIAKITFSKTSLGTETMIEQTAMREEQKEPVQETQKLIDKATKSLEERSAEEAAMVATEELPAAMSPATVSSALLASVISAAVSPATVSHEITDETAKSFVRTSGEESTSAPVSSMAMLASEVLPATVPPAEVSPARASPAMVSPTTVPSALLTSVISAAVSPTAVLPTEVASPTIEDSKLVETTDDQTVETTLPELQNTVVSTTVLSSPTAVGAILQSPPASALQSGRTSPTADKTVEAPSSADTGSPITSLSLSAPAHVPPQAMLPISTAVKPESSTEVVMALVPHQQSTVATTPASVSPQASEWLSPPMMPSFELSSSNVESVPEPISLEDEDDSSLQLMKLRILAMKHVPKEAISPSNEMAPTSLSSQAEPTPVKQMERVPICDFAKDVLEDITEESERNSISTAEEQQSLSLEKSEEHTLLNDSLSVLKSVKERVQELQARIGEGGKDNNNQSPVAGSMEVMRRGSSGAISTEQLGSGRDTTSSLVTNSTEYRTIQEDPKAGSELLELLRERDSQISNLSQSLDVVLRTRDEQQSEIERLTSLVELLRSQSLAGMEPMRRQGWPRDQESNCGQRISEISMDLISESDDELNRQIPDDGDERQSRSSRSRERQLSVARDVDAANTEELPPPPLQWPVIQNSTSRDIEQFKRYLTPSELRLFFMVQAKFNEFMCQELQLIQARYDNEVKSYLEQMEKDKEEEVQNILNAQSEKDVQHAKEMEGLRKYFETKCADMEKQYSDEVFSQKSQRAGIDSSSAENSDMDQLPEEVLALATRSKDTSPRKRTRAELLLSPSHRQMTPSGDAFNEDIKDDNGNVRLEIANLKAYYHSKIFELKRVHEGQLRQFKEKLKYYEKRYQQDDLMFDKDPGAMAEQEGKAADAIVLQIRDSNSSLIIIDQDETGEQALHKIIEEYERRLKEQVDLARADVANDLEQKVRNLISDPTADDSHWPPELILLREKFTARSQLEVAQLQIKHEEEMSRLKLEYRQKLTRRRQRTFDSSRDFDDVINERDGLRELTKSLRSVLAELAKCLVRGEDNLNESILDRVQQLLHSYSENDENAQADRSATAAEHSGRQPLQNSTLNASLLQISLNSSASRMLPDVHSLLEIIEDSKLQEYINKPTDDAPESDNFDLADCLERLHAEANYLLRLSQNYAQQRMRRTSDSSQGDKENEPVGGLYQLKTSKDSTLSNLDSDKTLLSGSFNELEITKSPPEQTKAAANELLNAILAAIDEIVQRADSTNASALTMQVHELHNRLVKSEAERAKLKQHLGKTEREVGALRRECLLEKNAKQDITYTEGYGLGLFSCPTRNSAERSSSTFAELQERARVILATPPKQQKEESTENLNVLLQMIEDFCRESERIFDAKQKDIDDYKSQIDGAGKRMKALQKFVDEQAIEREQERDEFMREVQRLQKVVREQEKDRNRNETAEQEVARLEGCMKELTQQLQDSQAKCEKFEAELKASIDKIFMLREIISDLETQVETKALNEHVLGEKIKELENYINSQSCYNETLQNEVRSLKTEITDGYEGRIRMLEEKLQNVRPSTEQSLVLDQLLEQLRDIESTLTQKTKSLETLHQQTSNSNSNNSGSHSAATEDVSVHGQRSSAQAHTAIVSPPQGSPVHPSPRQHSFAMESMQRIIELLSRHTRVEEAAIKRIHDLELQMQQMQAVFGELTCERDLLRENTFEMKQRISSLKLRLEQMRLRADELERGGTGDLKIRIHHQESEVKSLRDALQERDEQIASMKLKLEKSRVEIDRLEVELAAEQQPDRSCIEKLQAELKQKTAEIEKLKQDIKQEMIKKLAVPDLMETILADKNEEIDHLKEQLETREKQLQTALELSGSFGAAAGLSGVGSGDANRKEGADNKDDVSHKLSARTLSDIVSLTEFDEPDVIRRAATTMQSPLVLPEASNGEMMHNTLGSSKEVLANLTYRRIDDLSGFTKPKPVNTFDNPHYFQDPNAHASSAQSLTPLTPALKPRQINFSDVTEDSQKLTQEIEVLKANISAMEKAHSQVLQEKQALQTALQTTQIQLSAVQADLAAKEAAVLQLEQENAQHATVQREIESKQQEIAQLREEQAQLNQELKQQAASLERREQHLLDAQQNESNYQQRIKALEQKVIEITEHNVKERESLRQELKSVSEAHEQCQLTRLETGERQKHMEKLQQELRKKHECLQVITTKLTTAEESNNGLQRHVAELAGELERLRQPPQHSEASKLFSVDEIAQQVEKELNYSAQLDSNILKAIESEEENNMDTRQRDKDTQAQAEPQGTDDENFAGERELLNQVQALKAQMTIEREHNEALRKELYTKQQHSQDIQEQDVVIIKAMRQRLETAMGKEEELQQQLDEERERADRLQTQLTALQRAESRRNSSLALKSPAESPRKSPRVRTELELELSECLMSEIKMLAAQNERERERCTDVQRNSERERQRYDKELGERIAYCNKLKKEMEKLSKEKENAECECTHLQERLTYQTQEIESLEARLVTLQEAETRRATRWDRQQKETVRLQTELHELRTKLLSAEDERDKLSRSLNQLRYDIERTAQRESKLREELALAHKQTEHNAVPQQFLQKMKEINALLAENTHENRQMADTVQVLVEERHQLQQKCEDLEKQLSGVPTVSELEERCNYLIKQYFRVVSHRKALVYQKRYLQISLKEYEEGEQQYLAEKYGHVEPNRRKRTNRFKIVALAIIAIQRIKFIERTWQTGKRFEMSSVFTVKIQKRAQQPTSNGSARHEKTPLQQQPPPPQNFSPHNQLNRMGLRSLH